MTKRFLFIFSISILMGCQQKERPVVFVKYNETTALEKQQKHKNNRMKFKLFQSKVIDMNEVFKPFEEDLSQFTEENYLALKPFILEQNIPSLQKSIKSGALTYEKLTLFYLYRIRKFERDSTLSLNSIIALNPKVLKEARERDKSRSKKKDAMFSEISIYGMPILLKDNINTKEMKTTAGAIALAENQTENDAFIVEKLKENGALILGKVNLSEWAYFFCSGCPLGYSAIGGQTLNPYGSGLFETGGSSAGSAVTVASNFAVAAIGTETSGSITSPSSQNSVVGLKPTIGTLSRSGIVPISSTLDTPGPMAKNVTDTVLLFLAMVGKDPLDAASFQFDVASFMGDSSETLKGKRLGFLKTLMTDSIYALTIEKLKNAGAEMIEIAPPNISFNGFLTLLNTDMKHDLPKYLAENAPKVVLVDNVEAVVDFNKKDTLLRAPYGQQLFEGIVEDTTTLVQLEVVKATLKAAGENYLKVLKEQRLDAILSINNYHSGIAAVAHHPTLTVPMGYKKSGEPISLTFIGNPFSERKLVEIGFVFEQLTKVRKMPNSYQ